MKFREQSSVHFTLQILQLRSSDLNAAWSWLHLLKRWLSFFASNSVKNRKGVIFSVPKRVNCLFVSQFLLFSTMLVGYRLVRIYVLPKVVFRPTRLSPVSVLLRYERRSIL